MSSPSESARRRVTLDMAANTTAPAAATPPASSSSVNVSVSGGGGDLSVNGVSNGPTAPVTSAAIKVLLLKYDRFSRESQLPHADDAMFRAVYVTPMKAEEKRLFQIEEGEKRRRAVEEAEREATRARILMMTKSSSIQDIAFPPSSSSSTTPTPTPTPPSSPPLVDVVGGSTTSRPPAAPHAFAALFSAFSQLVADLEGHWLRTVQLLALCTQREAAMRGIMATIGAYKQRQLTTLQLQTAVFQQLHTHQQAALAVVEGVFRWRAFLSRPYPFLYKGENALLSVLSDCDAFEKEGLQSVVPLLLRQHPLCSNMVESLAMFGLQEGGVGAERGGVSSSSSARSGGVIKKGPDAEKNAVMTMGSARAASSRGSRSGGGGSTASAQLSSNSPLPSPPPLFFLKNTKSSQNANTHLPPITPSFSSSTSPRKKKATASNDAGGGEATTATYSNSRVSTIANNKEVGGGGRGRGGRGGAAPPPPHGVPHTNMMAMSPSGGGEGGGALVTIYRTAAMDSTSSATPNWPSHTPMSEGMEREGMGGETPQKKKKKKTKKSTTAAAADGSSGTGEDAVTIADRLLAAEEVLLSEPMVQLQVSEELDGLAKKGYFVPILSRCHSKVVFITVTPAAGGAAELSVSTSPSSVSPRSLIAVSAAYGTPPQITHHHHDDYDNGDGALINNTIGATASRPPRPPSSPFSTPTSRNINNDAANNRHTFRNVEQENNDPSSTQHLHQHQHYCLSASLNAVSRPTRLLMIAQLQAKAEAAEAHSRQPAPPTPQQEGGRGSSRGGGRGVVVIEPGNDDANRPGSNPSNAAQHGRVGSNGAPSASPPLSPSSSSPITALLLPLLKSVHRAAADYYEKAMGDVRRFRHWTQK